MTKQTDNDRYLAAAHAMQTGVALEIGHENVHGPADPGDFNIHKHLRVGINSAFVSQAALTKLLIEKGIFTMAEYEKAQADEMENEVIRYEARHPGVTLA